MSSPNPKLTEITDLFAQLALNLKTLDPTANKEEPIIDLSISNLNRSLNLDETSSSSSRTRVLDTALSLMCFKAPQVYDTGVKCLVNTLVTILSSSVGCKLFKIQKAEYMRVGGVISISDCAELVESFADMLQQLEGHGICYQSLLYAGVKAAVSASCFYYGSGVVPILNSNSSERGIPAVSKLLRHLSSDLLFKDEDIPLRLLFWYVDPMILKSDLSNMLKDVTNRPFICLETAFHERMDWRSMLICLAFSPAMFVKARALLHNWFMMTGVASVLELQMNLVLSILDVISRPMRWGLSMELGLKLPSSSAYFAHGRYLLKALEGPLLCQTLPDILHMIKNMANRPLDHNSPWAIAMNFPDWLYFASSVLFRGKSPQDKAVLSEQPNVMEPAYISAAARYIAWILEPASESHQELLVEFLNQISELWVLKKCKEREIIKQQKPIRRRLKKAKTHDSKDNSALLQSWLEEFQNMYINYLRKTKKDCSQGISSKQNMLLRRILLGILMGDPHEIDENGSQLLLHYAVTGKFCDSQYFLSFCNKNEAVAGAKLLFSFTDIVESMSLSLFDSEDNGIDFIYNVKLRLGRYLLSCVKRLLDTEKDDVADMFSDLYTKLGQWRLIGKDVFGMAKDFDDVNNALSHRLSSL